MKFTNVADTAEKWSISERSVRNYCAQGRIKGAYLNGKTWMIPRDAKKPERKNKRSGNRILEALKNERPRKYGSGIYNKVQIELTYNSNHMEGSKLTHDQTRYIFETDTIGAGRANVTFNVDDIIETKTTFDVLTR